MKIRVAKDALSQALEMIMDVRLMLEMGKPVADANLTCISDKLYVVLDAINHRAPVKA